MHEPFSAVLRYFGFWGSLVLFKLAFGYLYVVRPMVTPSIALYDEYMNFPEVSFTSTLAQFAAHWSPHFLIFLIEAVMRRFTRSEKFEHAVISVMAPSPRS